LNSLDRGVVVVIFTFDRLYGNPFDILRAHSSFGAIPAAGSTFSQTPFSLLFWGEKGWG
jgi:hypothetical protein